MVVGSAANGTLNVTFTLVMGYVFIDLFERPDFDSLDIKYIMAYFLGPDPYLSSAMPRRVAGLCSGWDMIFGRRQGPLGARPESGPSL
jgi:hypothetical protein